MDSTAALLTSSFTSLTYLMWAYKRNQQKILNSRQPCQIKLEEGATCWLARAHTTGWLVLWHSWQITQILMSVFSSHSTVNAINLICLVAPLQWRLFSDLCYKQGCHLLHRWHKSNIQCSKIYTKNHLQQHEADVELPCCSQSHSKPYQRCTYQSVEGWGPVIDSEARQSFKTLCFDAQQPSTDISPSYRFLAQSIKESLLCILKCIQKPGDGWGQSSDRVNTWFYITHAFLRWQ